MLYRATSPLDRSSCQLVLTEGTSQLAAFFSSSWNSSGMSCSNGKALIICRWRPEKRSHGTVWDNPSQLDLFDITYFCKFAVGKCYTDKNLAIFLSIVGPKVMFIPLVWELWHAVQEPDSTVSSVHHQNPWGTRQRSKAAEDHMNLIKIRDTKAAACGRYLKVTKKDSVLWCYLGWDPQFLALWSTGGTWLVVLMSSEEDFELWKGHQDRLPLLWPNLSLASHPGGWSL